MGQLTGLCNSTLWDFNSTWNTPVPDFTECFQSTVLVWVPTLTLLVLSPWKIKKILNSKGSPQPWNGISVGKLVLNVCLALMYIVEIVFASTRTNIVVADILAPVLQLVSIIIVIGLSLWAKCKGVQTTVVLPTYWVLQTVANSLKTYSASVEQYRSNTAAQLDELLMKSGDFVIGLIQAILSGFSENAPALQQGPVSQDKTCPLDTVAIYSRLTFFWSTSYFKNEEMTHDKLPPLCLKLRSEHTGNELESKANLKQSFEIRKKQEVHDVLDDTTSMIQKSLVSATSKRRSLLFAFLTMSWGFLLLACFCEVLSIVLTYAAPYFFKLILDFMEVGEFAWHGYFYGCTLFLVICAAGFAESQKDYFVFWAAARVKSGLVTAIYRKVFRMSSGAKRQHEPSHITSYVATDSEHLFHLWTLLLQIWGVPLRLAIGLYLLWLCLGASAFLGLVVIAVVLPLNLAIAGKVTKFQKKRMLEKNEKMKLLTEILNGMKMLKMYAWELPFMRHVESIRKKEMTHMHRQNSWNAAFSVFYSTAPFLVVFVSFAVYVLTGDDHDFKAQTAFVSLVLLDLLRVPLGQIPDLLKGLSQGCASLRKLEAFFDSEDLHPNTIRQNPPQGHAVSFDDATLTWDTKQDPTLKNLSLDVKERSLVAVVGPQGSGKSSKLSALLGDMYVTQGRIHLKGSVAFMSQRQWIQNATLKENILFNTIMDRRRYQAVLDACALSHVLQILPEGDQTTIGKKGFNLNRSQKQRVSLARAVYQDRDVYLLDKPLDAVSTHKARHIFQDVIGPNGLLKDKVRILVTDNVTFLPEVDHIVFMKDGAIVEQGGYQELVSLKGHFTAFVESRLGTREESWSNEQQSDGDSMKLKHHVTTDDANQEIRQIPWSLYLDYLRDIGWSGVVLILLTSCIRVAIEVGSGVWISLWNSDFMLNNKFRIAFYGAFVFYQGIFVFISIFWQRHASRAAAAKLHQRVLRSIFKAPVSYFQRSSTETLLTRLAEDVESVDKEIPEVLHFWMDTFLWIIAVSVVLAVSSPYILLSIIPMVALCYIMQKMYVSASIRIRHLVATSWCPVHRHFQESATEARSIRGFGAEEQFTRDANKLIDSQINSEFLSMVISKWFSVNLNILGATVVLLTSLLAVSQREAYGTEDAARLGLIALAIMYALQMAQRLSVLGKFGSHLESRLASVDRLQELTRLEEEGPWRHRDSQPPPYWPGQGAITIRNLSVTEREGSETLLQNMNLHIKPGEKVAFVDRKGSGKSSLIHSLFRILEADEGTIHVDGLDISGMGLHDWRSRITIIPQESVIFSGSLRMNLDPWNQCYNTEIWDALKQVKLDAFVYSLPDRVDYLIEKGSSDFSAGQRQLISLARAHLRRTRILVVDESPTPMDPEIEKIIKTVIRNNFPTSTILTMVHRLQTALHYDRVIILSEGAIVEDGNPRLLLRLSTSVFRTMAVEAGIF